MDKQTPDLKAWLGRVRRVLAASSLAASVGFCCTILAALVAAWKPLAIPATGMTATLFALVVAVALAVFAGATLAYLFLLFFFFSSFSLRSLIGFVVGLQAGLALIVMLDGRWKALGTTLIVVLLLEAIVRALSCDPWWESR